MYATEKQLQKSESADPQVTRDLIAARDYILKHGWCQGPFEDEKGRVCLSGAIRIVTGSIGNCKWLTRVHSFSGVSIPLRYWAAADEVRVACGKDPISYSETNGRTVGDILGVLDRAIIGSRVEAKVSA